MPLVKGAKARSKEGFSENVRREVKAGKPVKQAVAIAYKKAGERKDSINNAPIYEENGEFFFPRPGSKERFGPYASKAEATSAAAKAGVVADDDEAILGRADAGYSRREEIENAEANLRYYEDQLKIQERRSRSKDRDEAEDGKASISWAKENIAKEKSKLARAKAHKDDAKADSLPPLARALAAADSMYTKALDSVHRKDAERDLPGAGTTEGNYGIDAERDLTGEGTADADAMTVKEARKLGKEYGERGNSRQRLQDVLKSEGATGETVRAALEAFDKV